MIDDIMMVVPWGFGTSGLCARAQLCLAAEQVQHCWFAGVVSLTLG